MIILKYWRALASVATIAMATLANYLIKSMHGELSGVSVSQISGDSEYVAIRPTAAQVDIFEIIVALIVVAVIIAIWAPAIRRRVNK